MSNDNKRMCALCGAENEPTSVVRIYSSYDGEAVLQADLCEGCADWLAVEMQAEIVEEGNSIYGN